MGGDPPASSSPFCLYVLKTTLLGAFFFACSISLTFYNKWLFKDFHFPLCVTLVHFLSQFLGAALVRWIGVAVCCKQWKPVLLPWNIYVKKVFPAGLAAALDIGMSNMSMMFITVSLYVMSKTTSVAFVLMFAIILRLESPRVATLVVVGFISGGLFMFTYKATQFNLFGFVLVMSASFLSGIRWVLLQLIMQREEIGLSHPIDTTYHMAPVMALGMIVPCVVIEGAAVSASEEVFDYHTTAVIESTVAKVAGGAFLAFLLTISEYLFVHNTSSLTLSVTGIFKEILTIALAAEINHDQTSALNMTGAGLCMLGITLHVILKASRTKNKIDKAVEKTKNSGLNRDESIELLDDYDSSDDDVTHYMTSQLAVTESPSPR